jgi:predicted amino acid-binding ACT domain protein
MILDLFGYDRHGKIREINTTLQRNALNTLDVSLAARAFNAQSAVSIYWRCVSAGR